ncbi:MAG: glycyl-radical enzyme activating protein [Armatimonadetes bacterium]|nr:glycyl-radical enzyme activating protein [Armatimonadota bacterium]
MGLTGEIKGVVFNIQHYCIHDGPGIRSTVFVKGCPLRCVWCQNPESQSLMSEVLFVAERCEGCGACVEACPERAIAICDGKARTNRVLCKGRGDCVAVCPNEARSMIGKEMSASDAFRDLAADSLFYRRSGGGITVSGGEPLAQPDFTASVCGLAKEAGLHTAIDTSGYAPWCVLDEVLRHVDLVLYDFKHMDAERHRLYTGVSNALILENARRIVEEHPQMALLARFAVIPGFNDDEDNIRATAAFVKSLGRVETIHLLPYHKFGEAKYERLEQSREQLEIEPPSNDRMLEIKAVFDSIGLTALIGG